MSERVPKNRKRPGSCNNIKTATSQAPKQTATPSSIFHTTTLERWREERETEGLRVRLLFHLDSNSTGLWGTIKGSVVEVDSFLWALWRACYKFFPWYHWHIDSLATGWMGEIEHGGGGGVGRKRNLHLKNNRLQTPTSGGQWMFSNTKTCLFFKSLEGEGTCVMMVALWQRL